MGVTGNEELYWRAGIDTRPLKKEAQEVEDTIKKMARKQEIEAAKMRKSMEQAGKGANTYQETVKKIAASSDMKKHTAEVKRLEDELRRVKEAGKGGLGEFNNNVKKSTGGLNGLMGKLKGIAAALGIAFGLDKLLSFLKGVRDITAEFQKYKAVLTNTLGSGSAADRALRMIQDFAAKTPFSVQELTESFVKLANRGIKPTEEQMRQLGDLASSTGKSFDQLTEAILDGMTGEFERLKEFGIRAQQEGDRVTFTFKGVTTEVAKTDEAIKDYILSLGDLEGVTGGMAAISKTLGGQMSNLGDSMDSLMVKLGTKLMPGFSGFIGLLDKVISGISNLISSQADEDNAIVKNIASNQKQAASAQSLLNRYEELTAKGVKPTAENKKELDQITLKLKDSLGESVIAIDAETGALRVNKEAVKEAIKQRLLLSNQEASSLSLRVNALNEEEKALKQQEMLLKEQLRIRKEATQALNIPTSSLTANLNPSSSGQFGGSALAATLSPEQQRAVKEYQNVVSELATTTRDLNSTTEHRASLLKQLTALGFTAADVERLFADELAKENVVKAKNTQLTKEQIKALDEERERRRALMEQINELGKQYQREAQSQEKQEEQAIAERFEKLAATIQQFNADPKNKVKINPSILNPIRGQAEENLTAKRETELLKIEIEKKKQLYQDFEEFKSYFGEKKSLERFSDELEGYETFLQRLKAMMPVESDTSAKANFFREAITAEMEKATFAALTAQQTQYRELLQSLQNFEEKRTALQVKYQADRARLLKDGEDNAVAELDKRHQEELTALDLVHAKMLENYGILFEGIEKLSRAHAKKVLADAQARVNAEIAANTITLEAAKAVQEQIDKGHRSLTTNYAQGLTEVASMLSEIAFELSAINAGFANFIQGAARAVNSYGQILKASQAYKEATGEEKFLAGAELATQAIAGIATVISTVTNAAKARKEAEQAYYAAVIQGQREYNLALNDQIRLRAELDESVFLRDYKGQIISATEALTEANREYMKALQDLVKGEAKIGQRNAIDWGAVGKAAAGGAAAGAAIGSVVPIIGTAIGAAVGAVAGAVAGLFGGKKKEDVFGGLLQEYPELITRLEDGTLKVNEALAKTLIEQNLVNEETKALIQNTLDWAEAVEKAQEQIKGVITQLAGSLGNDLRSSLVSAFKDGEDAAKAFGTTVSKVVEDIVAQFLFNEIFAKNFKELEAEMAASFGLGGDQSVVDDLARFFAEAGPNVEKYNEAMEAARIEAEKYGLDIFAKNTAAEQAKQGALQGAIRGITADQADVLAGQFNGQRMATLQHLEVGKQQLTVGQQQVESINNTFRELQLIERNTYNTVQTLVTTNQILTAKLTEANQKLGSIDGKTSDVNAALRANGL